MKKLAGAVSAFAAGIFLSGCLVAPVIPPIGIIYSDIQAPLDYDQNESLSAGLRSGMGETISILGLVALGDASIRTAAQNGGITTVHGADYEYFNVLLVYQRFRVIVHGE